MPEIASPTLHIGPLIATTGAFSGLVTANAGLTVASGQTLTLTGATVVGLTVTAPNVGAGTFPAGAFLFQGTVGGITTLTLSSNIIFTQAGPRIIGGATDFAINNAANNASNLHLSDAGVATLRGNLVFAQANARIIPGATGFAINNTANNANNLLIADNGDTTIRGAATLSSTLAVTGVSTLTGAVGQFFTGPTTLPITSDPRVTVKDFTAAANGTTWISAARIENSGNSGYELSLVIKNHSGVLQIIDIVQDNYVDYAVSGQNLQARSTLANTITYYGNFLRVI